MGKKKLKRRTKIKSFVKVANYNHLMPTRFVKRRALGLCVLMHVLLCGAHVNHEINKEKCFVFRYSIDVSFDKGVVNKDAFTEPSKRRKARAEVKTRFEER